MKYPTRQFLIDFLQAGDFVYNKTAHVTKSDDGSHESILETISYLPFMSVQKMLRYFSHLRTTIYQLFLKNNRDIDIAIINIIFDILPKNKYSLCDSIISNINIPSLEVILFIANLLDEPEINENNIIKLARTQGAFIEYIQKNQIKYTNGKSIWFHPKFPIKLVEHLIVPENKKPCFDLITSCHDISLTRLFLEKSQKIRSAWRIYYSTHYVPTNPDWDILPSNWMDNTIKIKNGTPIIKTDFNYVLSKFTVAEMEVYFNILKNRAEIETDSHYISARHFANTHFKKLFEGKNPNCYEIYDQIVNWKQISAENAIWILSDMYGIHPSFLCILAPLYHNIDMTWNILNSVCTYYNQYDDESLKYCFDAIYFMCYDTFLERGDTDSLLAMNRTMEKYGHKNTLMHYFIVDRNCHHDIYGIHPPKIAKYFTSQENQILLKALGQITDAFIIPTTRYGDQYEVRVIMTIDAPIGSHYRYIDGKYYSSFYFWSYCHNKDNNNEFIQTIRDRLI
jgi:hypothetical protein